MTAFLTITLLNSILCSLAILVLRGAPARLRFYICIMLLVSWLTPWQLLQFEAVPNAFVLPLNILSEFNLVNPTGVTKGARLITPLSEQTTTPLLIFYWLWLAAFAIGLILLFKDIVSYIKLRRH
jgi:hypothetical protein